ncbi:hypothetical protein ACQKM2_37055 [Streptomyces sp. NPDC004126]|uniref:hypothetical protein n=1 Tax=Streptomyces sp. NPDC004126 TaxID=3390695 RepID=UPI003D0066B3
MISEDGDPTGAVVQNVTAVNGFAYGVIGADLHIMGGGAPLYLLARWQGPVRPPSEWLRELPSRMLNARRALVPFVLRDEALGELESWRDGESRLAVRWLHAPGGQGKSRLAAELAERSVTEGWTAAAAFHGPDTGPIAAGSQDLTMTAGGRLLLIVDYADRWNLSALTWLLKNALLHRDGIKVRILMVARSTYPWPSVRATLDTYQADTSAQGLAELVGEAARASMFRTAADTFRRLYGLADTVEIVPPVALNGEEFGLVLALHIAALVAVDAHARNVAAPQGLEALTIYLLDREQLHWRRLYEDGGHDYSTPPAVMNRAVFTACLAGPLPDHFAGPALAGQNITSPRGVIRDHAFSYPPQDSTASMVLEPLYPDRLAEDFVALSLPGHDIDYPSQPWAGAALTSLLAEPVPAPEAAQQTQRLLTVLASAAGAGRWNHVAAHLTVLLQEAPERAITAGAAALSAIADVPALPPDVLKAIAELFPEGSVPELDTGMAAVVYRLAHHELSQTQDPLAHATVRDRLASRLHFAGMHREAVEAQRDAIPAWRHLADTGPTSHRAGLAMALANLALAQGSLVGRFQTEPRQWMEEARQLYQELMAEDPIAHRRGYATVLRKASGLATAYGEPSWSLTLAQDAVAAFEQLNEATPGPWEAELALAIGILGQAEIGAGRYEDALVHLTEAAEMYRSLPQRTPGEEVERLGVTMDLATVYRMYGRDAAALEMYQELLEPTRRLAKVNPATREPNLCTLLNNLAVVQDRAGFPSDALETAREAVAVARKLNTIDPVVHGSKLVMSLITLAHRLGRWNTQDSISAASEAVHTARECVSYHGQADWPLLGLALRVLREHMLGGGQAMEAIEPAREAVEILKLLVALEPALYREELEYSEERLALLTSGRVIIAYHQY